MSNFKVGDRVRCFDPNGPCEGNVKAIDREGNVDVAHDDGDVCTWHPFSVRRLRPKNKPEESKRVERVRYNGKINMHAPGNPIPVEKVQVIEIRPGETVVNVKKLQQEISARTVHWQNILTALGIKAEKEGGKI